jgi:hypothetical protein
MPVLEPWMDPVLAARVMLNEMRMERINGQLANGVLDRLSALSGIEAVELARRAAESAPLELDDDDDAYESIVGPTIVAALNAPGGYDYSHYAQATPAPTKKAGVMSFVTKQELPFAPVVVPLVVAFGVGVAASLTATLIWEERAWIGRQFMKLAPDGSWKPTGERPPILYDKETRRTFHKQTDGTYLPTAGPQRV